MPSCLKIRNLLDQAGIRTARFSETPELGWRVKPANVHLVDDGLGGRAAQRRVAFPIVRAAGPPPRSSSPSKALSPRGRLRLAAVIPGNNHAAPVRVEQNLGGIKPHAARGLEWPVGSISVKLPWLNTRHKYVPIMAGAVGRGSMVITRAGIALSSRSKSSNSTPEAFRE